MTTLTLHLGVIDTPYRNQRPTKTGRNSSVTTGDVATYIEDRYHVMEVFYEDHQKDIAGWLEESVAGAIQNLIAGGPPTMNALGDVQSKIEHRFKQFLSLQEVERMGIPGVPTQAALEGISHRFKHPYAKRNRRRPSFIDTGQYENNFKAWFD